jgi:ABC-type proline/glycine betaine transport system ATPase subunit
VQRSVLISIYQTFSKRPKQRQANTSSSTAGHKDGTPSAAEVVEDSDRLLGLLYAEMAITASPIVALKGTSGLGKDMNCRVSVINGISSLSNPLRKS